MYLQYIIACFHQNAPQNNTSKVPCILSGKRAPLDGIEMKNVYSLRQGKRPKQDLRLIREFNATLTALLPFKNTIDGGCCSNNECKNLCVSKW